MTGACQTTCLTGEISKLMRQIMEFEWIWLWSLRIFQTWPVGSDISENHFSSEADSLKLNVDLHTSQKGPHSGFFAIFLVERVCFTPWWPGNSLAWCRLPCARASDFIQGPFVSSKPNFRGFSWGFHKKHRWRIKGPDNPTCEVLCRSA